MEKPEGLVEEPLTFSASLEDLVARGKALRDKVPRASHSEWKPPKSRTDPIAILQAADKERVPELVPIRYGRMLPSAFTFFRGAAGIMAADLATTPTTGIQVQACGDCHLKNFGGFATPERNIVFDINDFDETSPAPWEWDLKRLTTSFVLAMRDGGLAEDVAADTASACARSYRTSMRAFADMHPLDLWYARMSADEFLERVPDGPTRASVERRIKKATTERGSDHDYPKLAEVTNGEARIRDNPPLIYHPDVTHSSDFREQVDGILKEYRLTLKPDRRAIFDRFRFVDAAIKVVGVGSVGTRCWIALFLSQDNEPLFLQFKEAMQSVLEPFAGKSPFANHGERVVTGQQLMQAASDIFLGWTHYMDRDFYIRQLRDAKIGPVLEVFDKGMYLMFAEACGWNLARAHAKTGSAPSIRGYLGKSDEFETAIGQFATAYADQTERDHAALKAAVKSGRIEVYTE